MQFNNHFKLVQVPSAVQRGSPVLSSAC